MVENVPSYTAALGFDQQIPASECTPQANSRSSITMGAEAPAPVETHQFVTLIRQLRRNIKPLVPVRGSNVTSAPVSKSNDTFGATVAPLSGLRSTTLATAGGSKVPTRHHLGINYTSMIACLGKSTATSRMGQTVGETCAWSCLSHRE